MIINETSSYGGSWWELALLALGTVIVVLVAITRSQEAAGGLTPLGWFLEKWGRFRCKHPATARDLWYDADKDVQFQICLACGADWYPAGCDGSCACHPGRDAKVTHCDLCDPFRFAP